MNVTKMRHQLNRATSDSRPPRTVTGLTPYQADRAVADLARRLSGPSFEDTLRARAATRFRRALHREVPS